MTTDWAKDIHDMHVHYGFHEKVKDLDEEKKLRMLDFRYEFLREELDEMATSIDNYDAEGVVDALIDLCVVAIGTLDLYDIDVHEAWNRVYVANMAKQVGIKASRPNPLGLPDLIKPEGWAAPDHADNHGTLQFSAPNLTGYDFVGVAPMNGPSAEIFKLRKKYLKENPPTDIVK
jgi:NTP pyrophosphatase (non-canonical NTP hydrolase)